MCSLTCTRTNAHADTCPLSHAHACTSAHIDMYPLSHACTHTNALTDTDTDTCPLSHACSALGFQLSRVSQAPPVRRCPGFVAPAPAAAPAPQPSGVRRGEERRCGGPPPPPGLREGPWVSLGACREVTLRQVLSVWLQRPPGGPGAALPALPGAPSAPPPRCRMEAPQRTVAPQVALRVEPLSPPGVSACPALSLSRAGSDSAQCGPGPGVTSSLASQALRGSWGDSVGKEGFRGGLEAVQGQPGWGQGLCSQNRFSF